MPLRGDSVLPPRLRRASQPRCGRPSRPGACAGGPERTRPAWPTERLCRVSVTWKHQLAEHDVTLRVKLVGGEHVAGCFPGTHTRAARSEATTPGLTCSPPALGGGSGRHGALVHSRAQTRSNGLDGLVQQRRHEVPWDVLRGKEGAVSGASAHGLLMQPPCRAEDSGRDPSRGSTTWEPEGPCASPTEQTTAAGCPRPASNSPAGRALLACDKGRAPPVGSPGPGGPPEKRAGVRVTVRTRQVASGRTGSRPRRGRPSNTGRKADTGGREAGLWASGWGDGAVAPTRSSHPPPPA